MVETLTNMVLDTYPELVQHVKKVFPRNNDRCSPALRARGERHPAHAGHQCKRLCDQIEIRQ